ncbi:MAG: hypothetical protein K2Y29_04000 [Beijerinckiaceae bacterium]|nr:hypothetical protein [Beijerinckiaceae bacterium]
MDRAAYYRSRAEECLQGASEAPEPLKGPLLALAQQWTRLAEYAERAQGGPTDEPGQATTRPGRQIWFVLPEQGEGPDMSQRPAGNPDDRSLEEG